ncbi:MAG: (2Fe-2S) ferredoxin domain-containing protein [Spirochaetia bacterium]
MAKMTLEELRKLRASKKKEINRRDVSDKKTQIIVGMGTCGIAAGAKDTLNTFLDELDDEDMQNIVIKQSGCMGLCYAEPTVEIISPEMPTVIYGKVDSEIAKKIIRKHIHGKVLINDHIYDRPAIDIVEAEEKGEA